MPTIKPVHRLLSVLNSGFARSSAGDISVGRFLPWTFEAAPLATDEGFVGGVEKVEAAPSGRDGWLLGDGGGGGFPDLVEVLVGCAG